MRFNFDDENFNNLIRECCGYFHGVVVKDIDGKTAFRAGGIVRHDEKK